MGGYQNYGPLLGPLNTRCRTILRTPKRDHNFDNHPHDYVGFFSQHPAGGVAKIRFPHVTLINTFCDLSFGGRFTRCIQHESHECASALLKNQDLQNFAC